MNVIIPFTSAEATLAAAGGKGANLARLTRCGFAVPAGFIVSTQAYHSFVAANDLQTVIQSALERHPEAPERVSAQIRDAFAKATLGPETAEAIRSAYRSLPRPARPTGNPETREEELAVAVRSSATLEDLPDLSFAGQLDTSLNVIGPGSLLQAIVHCWSSLWTPRAIGYRARNGIRHGDAGVAVVVQVMVPSEVSGVLFTANPLTGLRSQSVVDAVFGLGEGLVSGRVEPDHFVVDTATGTVVEQTLGAKSLSIRPNPGGGVEAAATHGEGEQTLAPGQIQELTQLGVQIQREYGAPQDIEWASAGDKMYVLQTRPITSLFPVPEVSLDPLAVWFSFGAVQGLLGPMTPLGRDVVRHLIASAGAPFGLQLDPDEQHLFVQAGERLWVRISDVMRHPIGSRVLPRVLGSVEPSVGRILQSLTTEPALRAGGGRLKATTLCHVARFALPVLARMVVSLVLPRRARSRLEEAFESYLSAAVIAPASDRFSRLANTTSFIQQRLAGAMGFLLPRFVPVFGLSMAALTLLRAIARDDEELVLQLTRALRGNVTIEMDLALWETAEAIRAAAGVRQIISQGDAQTLARRYLEGALPEPAQTAIARFMDRYGMRGAGEFDLGRPRWREDPTPVIHSLQGYLALDPEADPVAQLQAGRRAASHAIESLVTEAHRQRGGWLRSRVVLVAALRIRALMGVRESPKFLIVRLMGLARQALLEVGQQFVEAGTLSRPDDLTFLRVSELAALSRNESQDWRELVAGRRIAYEREQRRQQVPRVLVSDGRAFYRGLGSQADDGLVITGSPVSPGVVEGIVHVVRDPHGAQLSAGEILVCPGTDPAWTPLFVTAAGLVTEVGGMMTHGSVVAREYGIPAVVGVHEATTRLVDGQRIRLDGTVGRIVIVHQ